MIAVFVGERLVSPIQFQPPTAITFLTNRNPARRLRETKFKFIASEQRSPLATAGREPCSHTSRRRRRCRIRLKCLQSTPQFIGVESKHQSFYGREEFSTSCGVLSDTRGSEWHLCCCCCCCWRRISPAPSINEVLVAARSTACTNAHDAGYEAAHHFALYAFCGYVWLKQSGLSVWLLHINKYTTVSQKKLDWEIWK